MWMYLTEGKRALVLKSGLTAVKVTGKQAALEDSPPTVRLFGNLEKQDCSGIH